MPAAPTIEDVNGLVEYDSSSAYLREDGVRSLLVIDRPPMGFNPTDIAAAYSYLRHVLRKVEGNPITVRGFRGDIAGSPIVLIVRVLN